MSASLTSVEIVEISNPIPAAQTQLLVDAWTASTTFQLETQTLVLSSHLNCSNNLSHLVGRLAGVATNEYPLASQSTACLVPWRPYLVWWFISFLILSVSLSTCENREAFILILILKSYIAHVSTNKALVIYVLRER
jgi:hypothetical protein